MCKCVYNFFLLFRACCVYAYYWDMKLRCEGVSTGNTQLQVSTRSFSLEGERFYSKHYGFQSSGHFWMPRPRGFSPTSSKAFIVSS